MLQEVRKTLPFCFFLLLFETFFEDVVAARVVLDNNTDFEIETVRLQLKLLIHLRAGSSTRFNYSFLLSSLPFWFCCFFPFSFLCSVFSYLPFYFSLCLLPCILFSYACASLLFSSLVFFFVSATLLSRLFSYAGASLLFFDFLLLFAFDTLLLLFPLLLIECCTFLSVGTHSIVTTRVTGLNCLPNLTRDRSVELQPTIEIPKDLGYVTSTLEKNQCLNVSYFLVAWIDTKDSCHSALQVEGRKRKKNFLLLFLSFYLLPFSSLLLTVLFYQYPLLSPLLVVPQCFIQSTILPSILSRSQMQKRSLRKRQANQKNQIGVKKHKPNERMLCSCV